MEEEKDKSKQIKGSENKKAKSTVDTTFRPVTSFSASRNYNDHSGSGKTVFASFLVGILGAGIVVGACFGVPSIRNQLFKVTNISSTSSPSDSTTNLNSTNNAISLQDYSETSVNVAAKVLPSVVGIKVEFPVNSIFSSATSTASGAGSGIIISEDGYILTNNHIVNSSSTSMFYEVGTASKVTVYLYNDETPYEAQIIGTDEQTDIAVIKIDKTGLTAAELGDSDSIKVGEYSMAIGNPLGMQSSVSAGIISAVNREITTDGVTYKLIQTDAAINAGNSGGALVNSKGQVIGINTMKISSTGVEGMGFSIPINSAKPIFEQLIEYKKVKRPSIGISGRNLTEQLAKANNLPVGVYVTSVNEFSAAEKAGIKIGDVILEVDGTTVKTVQEINDVKNSHQIGDTIKIKISRDGQEKEVDLKLQEE